MEEEKDLVLASDNIVQLAEDAEKRINAVLKIKQVALKSTNARDWTNQNGKPYLAGSGSEKIANLFNISWRIDEPICETENDGHFTFTYKGYFSMGGRSIEVEGSRSSKDPFFKKYEYINDKRIEKGISAIDRRDVKMSALTNLLGNGITRLLGIRNLTWEDLFEHAKIKPDMVEGVDYKKREPLKEPQRKQTEEYTGEKKTEPEEKKAEPKEESKGNGEGAAEKSAIIQVKSVKKQTVRRDGSPMKSPLYYIQSEAGTEFKTFDQKIGDMAAKEKGGLQFEVRYTSDKYGNQIVQDGLNLYREREPGEESV